MTVKIDGTNGIDTAQLRAPDGDPVAMTIGNDGKVAFPQMVQTWQNVAASRALGTPYQNLTSRDIDIAVVLTNNTANHRPIINIDGVSVTGTTQSVASSGSAAYARVPVGATYTVTASIGVGVISSWVELR